VLALLVVRIVTYVQRSDRMTKDEAIEWAGGKVIDLAAKLGITHGAVSKWESVPIRHQYRLERMSRGKLRVDQEERDFVEGRK
jgi:hypothetical protein